MRIFASPSGFARALKPLTPTLQRMVGEPVALGVAHVYTWFILERQFFMVLSDMGYAVRLSVCESQACDTNCVALDNYTTPLSLRFLFIRYLARIK